MSYFNGQYPKFLIIIVGKYRKDCLRKQNISNTNLHIIMFTWNQMCNIFLDKLFLELKNNPLMVNI